MTLMAFDAMCLKRYRAAEPPKFLHFQWEGSEDVHRYMLVDKFAVGDIDPTTRRIRNEGSDDSIRDKYVSPTQPEVSTEPADPGDQSEPTDPIPNAEATTEEQEAPADG